VVARTATRTRLRAPAAVTGAGPSARAAGLAATPGRLSAGRPASWEEQLAIAASRANESSSAGLRTRRA
jgi:hypothetical protein